MPKYTALDVLPQSNLLTSQFLVYLQGDAYTAVSSKSSASGVPLASITCLVDEIVVSRSCPASAPIVFWSALVSLRFGSRAPTGKGRPPPFSFVTKHCLAHVSSKTGPSLLKLTSFYLLVTQIRLEERCHIQTPQSNLARPPAWRRMLSTAETYLDARQPNKMTSLPFDQERKSLLCYTCRSED